MLVDIFSSFDPATSSIFTSPIIFWSSISIFLILFMTSTWSNNSTITTILFNPTTFMYSQLIRGKSFILKSIPSIITPMFLLIILINLLGLLPYIFSMSSHLLFTLSLGLPMWLTLITSSAINSPSKFSASLLPSGAPSWLAPALILIETISISVRPITLSFRLAANMSAGHIVLSLVNMYATGALSISSSFMFLSMISIAYTLFEVGICLVQAYIFCLLLTLYADDHS